MKKFFAVILALCMVAALACGCSYESHAREEAKYQNTLMEQANDAIGMPDITNYYEKKLAKEIYELRDDSELICYAYVKNLDGEFMYLGRCMGYGLPYSTQYTCPETPYWGNEEMTGYRDYPIEQADPNGLYSPEGLSATWLWMIDEETGEPNIMYIESELTVTQSKLPARICVADSLPDNY